MRSIAFGGGGPHSQSLDRVERTAKGPTFLQLDKYPWPNADRLAIVAVSWTAVGEAKRKPNVLLVVGAGAGIQWKYVGATGNEATATQAAMSNGSSCKLNGLATSTGFVI